MKWMHRSLAIFVGLCAAGAFVAAPCASAASAVPNGGGRPLWSPDGTKVAFIAGTPNTPANVWVADVPAGARPRQLTRLGGRAIAWAPDGRSIYLQTMRDGVSSFRSVGVANGKEHVILSFLPKDVTEVAFSPDRRKVAYLKKHDDHMDLWLSGSGGGDRRQLSEGLKVRTMDWSHDGQRIAFDVGGVVGETTYVAAVKGEGKPRLVFTGIGSYPSWSPDGSRIALLGFHAVMIVSKDGSNKRRLHVSQSDRHALDWSPDGTYLAYASVHKNVHGISMVNVKSGEAVRLSSGWAEAAFPRWSPDGRSLVFEAARGQDYSRNLHLLDIHRQRRTQLTTDRPSSWDSRWSGDGEWLYAVSNAAGGGAFSFCRGTAKGASLTPLFAVDPSRPLQFRWPRRSNRGILLTGNEIRLLEGSAAPRVIVTTQHPTWADLSPSGDTLAYVRWQDHTPTIALLQIDGGKETELLPAPPAGSAYSHLAWSPGGGEIAFLRGGAVCKVPAAGGEVSTIFKGDGKGSQAVMLAPVWSPDGRWIVFGRVPQRGGPRLEIWLVSSDGARTSILADGRFSAEVGVHADPLADPYAWSRDGKQLAFVQELAGRPALYLLSIGTGAIGRPRLLRRSAAYPDWSPDGRTLAYTALSGDDEAIRLLRLSDRTDRPLRLRLAGAARPGGARGATSKRSSNTGATPSPERGKTGRRGQ